VIVEEDENSLKYETYNLSPGNFVSKGRPRYTTVTNLAPMGTTSFFVERSGAKKI